MDDPAKQEHGPSRYARCKGFRISPNKNAFVATNAYLAIYIPTTCLANNTKNEEGDCIETRILQSVYVLQKMNAEKL